jgi:glycolate oxidase FAD binding subunit
MADCASLVGSCHTQTCRAFSVREMSASTDTAFIESVQASVRTAHASASPLAVHGGQSKSFYGGPIVGEPLDMRPYAGIVDYQPRELVLTVRAGTTLDDVTRTLESENQMLAFEPPMFALGSTIGGAVAAGLSGPRRAYAGAVRDFILGARILNGKGEDLRFGGRVIKNVAGYDVSRLMAGAMGSLGILLDLSFKVLPKPAAEVTLRFEMDEATSILRFNEWAGQPLPLSASAWCDGIAHLRLSGTRAGVSAACNKLGGEAVDASVAGQWWSALRDHRHAFFEGGASLWRLSVPATTPPLQFEHRAPQLIEWGGALRWLRLPETADVAAATALRAKVEAIGGHATRMRAGEMPEAMMRGISAFHPINGKLAELNRNLRLAFDPAQILNRGRLDNF